MPRVIVVGGGAGGVPLAARLSEEPLWEVVLIEAGPARDLPAELDDGTTIRAALPEHPANWGHFAHLTLEHPYLVARGRVIGGSSTINGGYFVRARPGDLDRWALVGGPEWGYDRALPVLEAMEHDLDFGDLPGHGDAGPMPVLRPPQDNPAAAAFHAAALAQGFVAEPDKNGTARPGVGPVPGIVVDGIRVNTALAYLEPARGRPNLSIVGATRVLRVVFDGVRAVGVETADGVLDGDDVVLCAGAIGSPHLLLCSGVGPRDALESLGIASVVDLPVGQGFSDHPEIAVGWRPSRPIVDRRELFAFPTALNFDSSGEAARHPDGDLEILLSVKTLGHLLTGADGGVSSPAHADDLQLIVGLQSPQSRGVLSLESADPLHGPRIDYGYLESDSDRERLRIGVRRAVALLRAPAFADVFAELTELDDATITDDELLDAWMRAHLGTAIHMCGSAAIGPVVDGAGAVRGVDGLRVADTSILPDVPSRGTFATAVFIGELIARSIRASGR